MAVPIRVLIVDDRDVDGCPLGPLLSDAGPRITAARVCDLQAARIHLDAFGADAILASTLLPGVSEVIAGLFGTAANIPVLVWAEEVDEDAAVAALRAGAQDVLCLQRLTGSDLARALRFAVARSRAKTESQFGHILDESLTEIYVFDAEDLHLLHVNRQARKNLGYSIDELQMLTPLDLEPDFSPATFRNVLAPLRSEQAEKVAYKTFHRRKDGGRYPVQVHIIRSAYQSADVFVAVVLDITRQAMAEVDAREKETRLQTIMDTVVEAIVTIDRFGAIESFNVSAEQMFGYVEREIVGKNVGLLMPEQYRHEHDRFIKRFVDTGVPRVVGREQEIVAQRKDGSQFPIEITLAAANVDGNLIFTGVVRDITERKQVERAMAEKTLNLEVFARRLKQLHTLQTARYVTATQLLTAYIREGCEIFDMECGFVSRVTGERYRVEAAFCEEAVIEIGMGLQIEQTMCAHVVSGGQTIAFPGTGFVPHEPVISPFNGREVRSYIGTPIYVDNRIYGTLSYGSSIERQVGFTSLDIDFVEMMAESVGQFFELREAEHATTRTKRELDNFFAVSLDLLCISDADGYLARVNPAWEETLGYTSEELQSRPYLEFVHPDDREETRASIKRQREGSYVDHFVNRYRAKDGQYRWLSWKSRPASDDLLYSVARDVTSQKQLEEQLRLHSQVLENMVEGVSLSDERGIIRYTNPAQDAMFGYDRGDLVGQHVTVFNGSTAEENRRFFGEVAAHLRAHEYWSGEISNRKRDGTPFVTDARISRMDVGQRPHWVCVQQDISEQKRLTDLLGETQSMAAVGGWELDLRTNVLTWTDEVYRIHEVLPGTPMTVDKAIQFYHPDSRHSIAEAVRNAREQGEPYDLSIRLTTQRGRPIWVRTIGKAHFQNGRPYRLSGTFQDITELKELELIKNEFVSTVSHELRSPLTSINASLGLIANGLTGTLPEKAREMIGIASRNAERLVRLINDILDVQRVESGKMKFEFQKLDIAAVVEQALAVNAHHAEQNGVSFALTESATGIYVHADPDRLEQVMTNMLSNAAKFSPPEETVTVGIEVRGESVRVYVADHGPGISEAFQPFVFDKFSQESGATFRAREGTGLGLSISKSIVERLGGEIGFETEPGKGATFYFELPVRTPEMVARADDSRPEAAGTAGTGEPAIRSGRSSAAIASPP